VRRWKGIADKHPLRTEVLRKLLAWFVIVVPAQQSRYHATRVNESRMKHLREQLQTALDWMRDVNGMKRDGTATGLLNCIGSREMAEWHLNRFFDLVEEERRVVTGRVYLPRQ
jgi:hypothetical protein